MVTYLAVRPVNVGHHDILPGVVRSPQPGGEIVSVQVTGMFSNGSWSDMTNGDRRRNLCERALDSLVRFG